MEGKEFRKTKETLLAKQNKIKKEGNGNKPNVARVLTDEDVACGSFSYSISRAPKLPLVFR